jgi:hypothetical protein
MLRQTWNLTTAEIEECHLLRCYAKHRILQQQKLKNAIFCDVTPNIESYNSRNWRMPTTAMLRQTPNVTAKQTIVPLHSQAEN